MATYKHRQRQPHSNIVLLLFIFLHISISYSASSPQEVEDALLKFKQSLKDESGALSNWVRSNKPICNGKKNNWAGIVCSRGGAVWGLRLENMKLSGSIDIEALRGMPKLRAISVMNNQFSGPMPDFRRLGKLKGIYLANNQFDGSITPNAFLGLRRLKKVDLSNNKFSGEIPNSLSNLERLLELRLDGNQFEGPIPDLKSGPTTLRLLNVSNDRLHGPVPPTLSKFDPSSFAGNKELCGPPLSECKPASTEAKKKAEEPIPISYIIAGIIVSIIVAILMFMVIRGSKKDKNTNDIEEGSQRRGERTTAVVGGGKSNKGGESGMKLTFVKEDSVQYDLPDLLKAGAEILGSGSFGSSYKATFNDGNAVVVKRYKQMSHVGREEFLQHMTRLGRLSHPNLLPLVAYYYRKEEKLFIIEPADKGSLAILLHGQRRGKPTLDWPTRLKVIKGVANGLTYLYKELNCLLAPHGHLKSSNVLLSSSYTPLLGDYGLIPLINQESVQDIMVAYKSPEYFNNGRLTKKTDVWSLGILIIEVLTGKFPASYLQQGTEVDMSLWVESVIKEGFDKNMTNIRNCEGEMQKLLNIGIACCESNVDKRLDIKEACDKIEEIHERDR